MNDYVHDIVPQFSHTHINFQRVPLVDTSNPFVVRDVPTEDESMLVIHFRDAREVDFPYLLQVIPNSVLSRHDTLAIPGTKNEPGHGADCAAYGATADGTESLRLTLFKVNTLAGLMHFMAVGNFYPAAGQHDRRRAVLFGR